MSDNTQLSDRQVTLTRRLHQVSRPQHDGAHAAFAEYAGILGEASHLPKNLATMCGRGAKCHYQLRERTRMWTKPSYQKIRLGFEVTMYFKAV